MTELVRVTRGVWRPADQVVSLPGRCAALLTGTPPGTVVAGMTAARLHRLWLPEREDRARVEVVLRRDALVPRAHAGSRRRELHARRRTLRAEEVTLVDGVPATSPARTWTDIAEQLSVPDLVAAGDSAIRAGCSRVVLTEAVHRAARCRGVTAARTALDLLDGRSRSRPESHLRVGLIVRGIPAARVNEPIFDEYGQWLAEPDLSYDDVRLAIEYNGAEHATPSRMRRDITREIDLATRGGWRTLTLGPAEVFGRMDQTACLVRELRSSLARDRRRDRAGGVEW